MNNLKNTSNACGIVLAGGQGTRIRHLCPDLPKPMIPAAGRPFIEWVIRWLAAQQVPQIVVSLGHLADAAEKYFCARPLAHIAHQPAEMRASVGSRIRENSDRNSPAPPDFARSRLQSDAQCGLDKLRIRTVREMTPLGTGGAIALAAQVTGAAEIVVVANGDSLVLADLRPVWPMLSDATIDGVVLGLEVDDASRYGRLEVDAHGRLRGFVEKQPGRGVINGGVYLFRRRLLERFPPQRPLSMETEVFPALLAAGARLAVYACQAPFLDIGTPDSLAQADRFIRTHFPMQVAA